MKEERPFPHLAQGGREAPGWQSRNDIRLKLKDEVSSIGAQLLAHGEGHGTGVLAPEAAFDPTRFIAELARRGIRVEERIEEHGIIDDRSADALSRVFVAT